jgi:cellulose synthase/poly-beta-1,6-N-acetylglucosamine synthase-like glycosyltransferase
MKDFPEPDLVIGSKRPVAMAPDLTIVVPTLNERDNLEPLLTLIEAALGDLSWEVIFVDDDSTDGTADHARGLARRSGAMLATNWTPRSFSGLYRGRACLSLTLCCDHGRSSAA